MVTALAALLLLLGGFLFLRPPLLGGDTSYIIVKGRSMQPTLWEGDLVLARKAPNYAIGDVVAYYARDEEGKGGLVIHRIIGQEGEAFTFQGDNNDYVDMWTATPEQIAGKGWVAIPRLGALFQYLQNPLRMAVAVGAISLYASLLGFVLSSRPRGSRERRRRLRMRIARRRAGLFQWFS